jgi:integrase
MRGEFVDPRSSRVLLGDCAATWLDTVRPTLKPKTVASYESLLRSRILPRFSSWALVRIRPIDVQTWIAKMQGEEPSASRIRHAHVVLQLMLDAAVRDNRLSSNPAHGTRLPRLERREADCFDPATVHRLITAMPDQYEPLLNVLGLLGLRFGEAAALRRRSVDLLRRRLRVVESLAEISGHLSFGSTKSHQTRSVPFPPSIGSLERHLDEHVSARSEALVFTSPEGAPLRHSTFTNRIWKPTLEQLKLPPVGIHVLRHSAAARMIQSGASPKAVQSVLGHASAAFTLTVYGHMFDEDLDALAIALDSSSRGTGAVQAIR